MTTHLRSLIILLALAASACAPATRPSGVSNPADSAQSGGSAAEGRSLAIVLRVEPTGMLEGADDRGIMHKVLFSTTLGIWNDAGAPAPILARSVPELNTASWQVFPDGTMETIYPLRNGLSWHDGTPLTAADFRFSLRAERARVDLGMSATTAELRQMEDILAPDPTTVVIRWRQPYTEAAAPLLIPLPRHILEGPLDQPDPDVFRNLGYWTTDYIGAGPFRVDRWEHGALIEGSAFTGYALGRPKIARIRLTWNNDPNVTMTRMLSGDSDMAADGSLRFEQASVLRNQWKDQGVVILSPTTLRYVQFQARAEYISPRALLDVRARKALYHAVDRPALSEAMLDDRSRVAHTVPPPTVPYFSAVERAVTQYPFDLRRSEQLLSEMGATKGPDGFWILPEEGRYRLEVRGVSGGQEEQDTTIVSGQVRESGIDTSILLLPSSARAVDEKTKGTFPGLTLNNNTLARRDLGLDKFISSRIGGPHDAWVGGNRMGWSNPQFDQLFDQWTTSLDNNQRIARLVEMMKLLGDELPALPLYYNYQVVAHTAALEGPKPFSPETTRYDNIHQWTLR